MAGGTGERAARLRLVGRLTAVGVLVLACMALPGWPARSLPVALLAAAGATALVHQLLVSHDRDRLLRAEIAAHESAEEALRLDEERLESLLRMGRLTDASINELTDFALETGVRLTRSELGYLAFLNDDETVLTMHSWSKTAMAQCAIVDKPLVYPVAETGLWGEAVRQRRAIFTNDYAAPSPLKRGYPAGHVPVHRHVNVPIFDGDRIVAVAGVGNKFEPYDESDVRQLDLLMVGMWRLVQRRRAEEELEERVRARTAELSAANESLARTNAELEQFAYVASHDLQEPLRMVASYVQLLARRYRGQLDSDADEFIDFAVDGATRMKRLLNDLLDYSRVRTRGRPFEPVELRVVFEQALDSLAAAIAETHARVTSGPLPAVDGDPQQLAQLFGHLLGNALKFRDEQPPTVTVSAEQRDGAWLITVADRGQGFAPEFSERIFGLFERLHAGPTYPGTGIGLALCRNIVERHGGRIWAEAAPGQGARFSFTLPAHGGTNP